MFPTKLCFLSFGFGQILSVVSSLSKGGMRSRYTSLERGQRSAVNLEPCFLCIQQNKQCAVGLQKHEIRQRAELRVLACQGEEENSGKKTQIRFQEHTESQRTTVIRG